MLLFADDIALFTTNAHSLQIQLNLLSEYSLKWGLKINVGKTKICVFEKRKQIVQADFKLNGESVEIVDSFCYLGMKLTHTGNLSYAVKTLSQQALVAYNNILSIFSRVKLDMKTKLSLFEAMVVPILLYGSELWGIFEFKEVDKLQIKFYKHILGVRQQTPNAAVYGELGKYPLSVIAKIRSFKFWLKISNNHNSLAFRTLLEQSTCTRTNCWANKIKVALDNLGLNYIWQVNDKAISYLPVIKQRLYDQYIQHWNASIQTMHKLEYYSRYKNTFNYESYLDTLDRDSLRISLSQFRLCSHKLEIEFGRFSNIARALRLCKLCNMRDVETEYHFFADLSNIFTFKNQIFRKFSHTVAFSSKNN